MLIKIKKTNIWLENGRIRRTTKGGGWRCDNRERGGAKEVGQMKVNESKLERKRSKLARGIETKMKKRNNRWRTMKRGGGSPEKSAGIFSQYNRIKRI